MTVKPPFVERIINKGSYRSVVVRVCLLRDVKAPHAWVPECWKKLNAWNKKNEFLRLADMSAYKSGEGEKSEKQSDVKHNYNPSGNTSSVRVEEGENWCSASTESIFIPLHGPLTTFLIVYRQEQSDRVIEKSLMSE